MSNGERRQAESVHRLFTELEPGGGAAHKQLIRSIEEAARRSVVAYQANAGHPSGLLQDHDVDMQLLKAEFRLSTSLNRALDAVSRNIRIRDRIFGIQGELRRRLP